MKNLKYYIGGVLSILLILPIIDKLLELIDLWLETLKIKPTLKLLNYKKDTAILQEFIKEPENVDEYETEYYDDED